MYHTDWRTWHTPQLPAKLAGLFEVSVLMQDGFKTLNLALKYLPYSNDNSEGEPRRNIKPLQSVGEYSMTLALSISHLQTTHTVQRWKSQIFSVAICLPISPPVPALPTTFFSVCCPHLGFRKLFRACRGCKSLDCFARRNPHQKQEEHFCSFFFADNISRLLAGFVGIRPRFVISRGLVEGPRSWGSFGDRCWSEH